MDTNVKKYKTKIAALSLSFLLLSGALLSCKRTSMDSLFFTIRNNKDLEITFCDKGASIYSIKYKDTFITYHPKDKQTFLKDDYYYGKALGRIAGRVKDGKFKVNDKTYQLEINETGGKKNNSIHGGTHGLATKNFKHYIEETNDCYRISFNYISPSGEAGYPELLDTWYIYTIYKQDNKIDLKITATSTGTTPVNLSNHPYFRLNNEGDILNHTLEMKNVSSLAKFDVDADHKTDQVVIGETSITDSTITEWDFRNAKLIGKDIESAKEKDVTSGGYDHIWKWDNGNTCDVKLTNPTNRISLKVTSDADAVICYANCFPHQDLEINPGSKDIVNGAITIEPIKFFTKDQSSIDNLMITPDKPFTRSISYTITEE